MFERKNQPSISKKAYTIRLVKHAVAAFSLIAIALLIGIFGYHELENLSWLDSLLNASMILGGMGPTNPIHTVGGKVFASFYALFSGLIFLVFAAILFTPVIHRFLHHFHADIIQENIDDET